MASKTSGSTAAASRPTCCRPSASGLMSRWHACGRGAVWSCPAGSLWEKREREREQGGFLPCPVVALRLQRPLRRRLLLRSLLLLREPGQQQQQLRRHLAARAAGCVGHRGPTSRRRRPHRHPHHHLSRFARRAKGDAATSPRRRRHGVGHAGGTPTPGRLTRAIVPVVGATAVRCDNSARYPRQDAA